MKRYARILAVAVSALFGAGFAAFKISRQMTKSYKEIETSDRRVRDYYDVLLRWMKLKNRGICLDQYLKERNIKTVAIYGMGELGIQLWLELKSSDIEVAYGIDQNVVRDFEELTIVHPEGDLEIVDAVVVTPYYAFDTVEENIKKKLSCSVFSIKDLVFGISMWGER